MNQHDVKLMTFLNKLYLRDMKHAIDCGLHYYAFPLICQGIELLGSLFDSKSLDEKGHSSSRFSAAIDNLFEDMRYKSNQELFYTNLRCNMIHQLRVGSKLALTSFKHNNTAKSKHLTTSTHGTLQLVIEVFLEDFEKALTKLNNLIDKEDSRLDQMKINMPFFYYGPVPTCHSTFGSTSNKKLDNVI